jgi:hypothetical protein
MANPCRLTLGPLAAANATAVAASQTPGAAGFLVLTGGANLVAGPTLIQGVNYTNYAQFDVARRVSIASTGADSAVIFTVKGFNRDLQPISENITGVNAAAVSSVNDFLIVTSVFASAGTVGAITVGTNTTASTAWVLANLYASSWALSAAAAPVSGGTTSFQIEHTYDDVNAAISLPLEGFVVEQNSAVPPVTFIPTGGTSTTGTVLEVQYADKPIMAVRLTMTAGTGMAALWVVQGGIKS